LQNGGGGVTWSWGGGWTKVEKVHLEKKEKLGAGTERTDVRIHWDNRGVGRQQYGRVRRLGFIEKGTAKMEGIPEGPQRPKEAKVGGKPGGENFKSRANQ